MSTIHDSLRSVFKSKRLVFWYDPERQWQQEFESFADAAVTKWRVQDNEFGVKVAIHRNPDRYARHLLYFTTARPPDAENWLLDLLMQGYEYRADRASIVLQEVGLPYEHLPVINDHIHFFNDAQRKHAFKEAIGAADDARTLRLKMIAVITHASPELDALLLWFLDKASLPSGDDPVNAHLQASGLTEFFWREVSAAFSYASPQPSLRDFAVTLFRSVSPLESAAGLHPHARVFLQQWKDSHLFSQSFRRWSKQLEVELRVSDRLNDLTGSMPLGDADVFESFERYTLQWLLSEFMRGTNDGVLLVIIQMRRSSHWFGEYAEGYEALSQAIILRGLMSSMELRVDSIDNGVKRYVERWHYVDIAYRKLCYHQRRFRQPQLMEGVVEWAERAYVNNYLLPLSEQWGDQVRQLQQWRANWLMPQTGFFDHYVRPYLTRNQKVFVIISDALRFEAAAELVTQLRVENRWTAELEAMLAALPSHTQVGMAALLPGDTRRMTPTDGNMQVDGQSAGGLQGRKNILARVPDVKATAVLATEFMDMRAKQEARALLRDHDVVYIYHNAIDRIGDDRDYEANTAEAVETAYKDLLLLIRKVYSANGYNILLTADHGFLFQQSAIEAADDQPLPTATEWLTKNRRYAIGRGIEPQPDIKVFIASELGLEGDWQAAFPLSLGRFPLQGSGKRFVHGGVSLQEVVVPVIHVHIAREDDVEQVDVDLMRAPDRITTGRVSLALYQVKPVVGKTLPRALRIGIYAQDGTPLSETRTMNFDMADQETRQRERTVTLIMSRVADQYNNQDVYIRLEETLPGTSQVAIYKSQRVRLIKPFESDFDD